MRRKLGLALLMLFALVSPAAACTVSAFTMQFDTVPFLAQANVTTNCQPFLFFNYAYNLGLNGGNGIGANTTTRKMTGPANATLDYKIFQTAGLTTNWGNNPGIDTVSSTSTGANQTFTAYARVVAGQNVAPGTYTDTITASTTGGNFNAPGTTTFTVTATVSASCTVSGTALTFGLYGGTAAAPDKDANSIVTVNCTKTTPYYVNLNDGTNVACCWQSRMTGPGGVTLNYTTFMDPGHSIRWGNTYQYDGQAGTGTGVNQPWTVYGRIFGGQSVPIGSYADTVIAKITY